MQEDDRLRHFSHPSPTRDLMNVENLQLNDQDKESLRSLRTILTQWNQSRSASVGGEFPKLETVEKLIHTSINLLKEEQWRDLHYLYASGLLLSVENLSLNQQMTPESPLLDVLLKFPESIIRIILGRKNNKDMDLFAECLQVYVDLAESISDLRPKIWDFFKSEKLFGMMLRCRDGLIKQRAAMILEKCLSEGGENYLLHTEEGQKIISALAQAILSLATPHGVEVILKLMKNFAFFDTCYESLPVDSRCLSLEILNKAIVHRQFDPSPFLPSVEVLIRLFIIQAVELCSSEQLHRNAAEAVTLLQMLAKMSSTDPFIPIVRNSAELLQMSIVCLKHVHFLGKEGLPDYKPLPPLQENADAVADYPLYNFKKLLVCLIGNVCCNHADNQNLARELDGIPLILDCTPLDARNPFITQQCVLTLRFLLEGNARNQAVVAGLGRRGVPQHAPHAPHVLRVDRSTVGPNTSGH